MSSTLCPLSDLEQFDENENILHRADEQDSANTLTVSDHFTRLVWIDPNSPTLQRKGVPEETTQEEDDDEPEDEREHEEEDDARTAYEMDNASEEEGKQTTFLNRILGSIVRIPVLRFASKISFYYYSAMASDLLKTQLSIAGICYRSKLNSGQN